MRRMIGLLVVAVLVGGIGLSQAQAQPKKDDKGDVKSGGDRRGGDRGRPRTPEEWQKRMEEFRKRMDDRMRESLGASEEEWKILKPRIEKVQTLQRESRGGYRGGMMFSSRGRGPGGGSRPEGAPERVQSDVEKKAAALRSLLEDKASGAQAIKAALAAVRKARAASEKKLEAARKELLEILTVRQEAQCMLMGLTK